MLITISRQYGAGGSAVARLVADALGWTLVDNEFIQQVAKRAGLPPEEVANREERVLSFVERLSLMMASSAPELFPPETGTAEDPDEVMVVRMTERLVAELEDEGRAVLVGRAAPAVLGQDCDAVHVKLVAPVAFRLEQACQRLSLAPKEAREVLKRTDKNRARYHREYYDRDWDDPANYDMVLNTGRLQFDGAAAVIVARAREQWGLSPIS
jgi:cytidylate kinase